MVGKNAGECKEGMEPCYNTECDRCRQDFEARKPSIEERILVFNNSDTWNQMYAFISDGKTTHVEKTIADSFITQINMCIENYRLFHEKDARTNSESQSSSYRGNSEDGNHTLCVSRSEITSDVFYHLETVKNINKKAPVITPKQV